LHIAGGNANYNVTFTALLVPGAVQLAAITTPLHTNLPSGSPLHG
jgi:hypothetical protein